MDQVAKSAGVIPSAEEAKAATARATSAAVVDSGFWPSVLLTTALTSMAIGVIWDISWHETIGRDTFWTPAHMAIYLGGVLSGFTGGWMAIRHTFLAGPAERDASVSVFGARAPLGAWVAIWGALAMITSAPFDDWWHNAYGLDVKILSPPHAVLGLGMFGISVGALLMVLTRQNRLQDAGATKGSGLFVYTGGVFVLLGSVFILEYIFPNSQHSANFYIACAMLFPTRLVAMSCAGRISWPATRIAAVYMVFMCGLDWLLALFPAQPKLAPIFNPVTHMVPLPFPLLLIFPAIAIDLIMRKASDWKGWPKQIGLSLLLGAAFFGALILVQWPFAKFLLSPQADNWFFMGNRIWNYSARLGDWQTRFWESDSMTFAAALKIWILAAVGAGLGLFFGRWMRKVRR